jgi:hypothetical protein
VRHDWQMKAIYAKEALAILSSGLAEEMMNKERLVLVLQSRQA